MYVTLLLLSLVVFGSCHHGDNDDHLHDELDEMRTKLDRLTAKLQNAADTLNKRKENHDEADRKSRNMLIRLDRLRLNDGTDHCPEKYFKCATVTQCVANILVCDKVPDCADKSDEDENLCSQKLESGSVYDFSRTYYDRCAVDGAESARTEVYKFERLKDLPSVAQAEFGYMPTLKNGQTGFMREALLFKFATSTLTSKPILYGTQYIICHFFLQGENLETTCNFQFGGQTCYSTVASPM